MPTIQKDQFWIRTQLDLVCIPCEGGLLLSACILVSSTVIIVNLMIGPKETNGKTELTVQ